MGDLRLVNSLKWAIPEWFSSDNVWWKPLSGHCNDDDDDDDLMMVVMIMVPHVSNLWMGQ